MPTYDYACEACRHEFEEFQSITAAPLRKCPSCGQPKLRRLIGPGAGVLFKGSGFYQTDYRSESYKKAAEAEKKPSSTDAATKPAGADAANVGKNSAAGGDGSKRKKKPSAA